MGKTSIKMQTNVEFVTELMEGINPAGPLIQGFVIEALAVYSAKVIAAGPEKCDSALVSGASWVEAAKHVQKRVEEKYGPR